MRRYEFVDTVASLVKEFIEYGQDADPDMVLRINPVDLSATMVNSQDMQQEIAYSDEAIEEAAGVEGDESESATDFQAHEDADFYPLSTLIVSSYKKERVPSYEAIEKVADNYTFSR